MVKKEDFQKVLNDVFKDAISQGKNEIVITAGEVHRIAGDYPNRNHRIPTCCHVMRKNLKENDFIISQPPKGNGASLTIRYSLPTDLRVVDEYIPEP